MISRRDLFKGTMATGLSALFLSGCNKTGDVPQTPFPLLDANDHRAFIEQTIRMARQTFIGAALYEIFTSGGQGHVVMGRAGDPFMQNLEAAYSMDSKNITFRHPDDVRRAMQGSCQEDVRSGNLQQSELARCEDIIAILLAQRTRNAQPGILVHELTHAAQDRYNLTNVTLHSLVTTSSPDARKLYFLNEIMGDVLALRFHVEYAKENPDKELATIQNLFANGLSSDFYGLMRNAEQYRESDPGKHREAYRLIINLLISTGRYQSYEERVDSLIHDLRRDVPPQTIASQIENDAYDYYCSISNAVLSCDDLLSKSFIQSLDFSGTPNPDYQFPPEELRRIERLIENNQAMFTQWGQHLGIGNRANPFTP